MRNYFRQFLRDVRAQKLRMALTLFGIVWGTAAVTLLLAFGQGLHKKILVSQRGLGDAIVICWPTRTTKPWQGLPRGRHIAVDDDDIALVRRDVEEVDRISAEYEKDGAKVTWGTKTIAVEISGVAPEFADMRNLIPQEGGRFFNDDDVRARRRVVFLGNELAENLFGKGVDPVGKEVRLAGTPFLVVGVMVKKDQDSSYSGRDKDKATIPSTTYEAVFGAKEVDDFIFQTLDPTKVKTAKAKVVAALARRHRFDPADKEAVQMWDTTEGMRFVNTFFIGFRLFLGIVGALTLVVGGIGVSNIMNVAVEERTKEIGIKMALGAKRRYVLGQFLFETLCLTVSGGALGFLISWGICAVFPALKLEDYVGAPVISFQVSAITVSILGAIGLLAGFFPARTAASLRPIEALRM